MKEILQTDRLILRTWTIDDREDLFRICSDAEVMQHIGTGQPYQNIDEAQRFLNWAVAYQEEKGFCRWAVIEKASRKIIGSCGFASPAGSSEIELGYLFARSVWGKGYATEAAEACLRYGFEHLQFTEVVALTDPGHAASHRVLQKIGFNSRGIKQYDGVDTMVYTAVKSEP